MTTGDLVRSLTSSIELSTNVWTSNWRGSKF